MSALKNRAHSSSHATIPTHRLFPPYSKHTTQAKSKRNTHEYCTLLPSEMASASKPRKFGFSGILRGYGLTAPTIAASATVPASTRLQALPPTPSTSSLKTVPHEDHEVELITPAVIPDSTRKRVRDEEADNERPTKQARLDSSITSRIARSQAVMRSIPKMPRAGSLAAHTQKKATISQRLQQVRRTSSTRTTVAPAAPGTPHAGPVIYPHNTTYAKARDCDGWPRDKIETSDHGSETVQKSAAGQGADLQCQRALNAEEESTTPSAATPTEAPRLIAMEAEIRELKMALEREREATRSKSAQVLRLIESNTEQKNETGRAIEGLTARVQEGFLALKEKSDECVTLKQQNGSISASKDQQIKLLRDQIQQLQGENADVSSRKGDLEAQVNRLNSCNDYLQVSIKNAADAEFKIAARNSDLLVQLRDAKEQKDEAEQARDAALTDIANAKSRATAFKGMSRALATALSTLRADIIGVHEYLSADCDMDSEAKDDTAWQPDYRNYVKLPPIAASLPPSDHQSGPKKALSLFGRSEPDPTSPASFELLGSFAKPSLEYTGSFGMPSLAGANQHHQAKTSSTEELNEVQRTLREFSRELQATKQQSNELSTWIAKKEIGEHAPPPPNEKQRAFEQYVDSLVADKVHNGMSFSSGEPARAFSSDADVGMDEAPPSGPRATTSTYVDFASAPTFGPDGWPMQTDDHAYHKSVSRHNTTTFSTERKAKGKGKQSGDHESAKQSAWRYDNSAGKRQGLDISMGHNDAPDHSKEEQIFNRNSGKKGQRDGDQHVSQNKRGGKHDNSRGKSDSKGKRGGSANRGGKGGNGDFSHDSVNNSGRGRGDGGFRGGRGGRGRGRGGRGGRGGR